MAISVTNQSTTVLTSSYGTSPVTVTLPATPTSGNMLLVGLSFSVTSTGMAVTDNQGNTYTELVSFTQDSRDHKIFRSNNLTGTMPTTLSLSWTGGGSRIGYACTAEYSGVDGTTPLDTTGTSTTGYGTSEQVSFTTSTSGAGAFAYSWNQDSRTMTVSESGYTLAPNASEYTSIVNADIGTAGAKTLTLTFDLATHSTIAIAALRAASGGGSVMPIIANHNMRRRA